MELHEIINKLTDYQLIAYEHETLEQVERQINLLNIIQKEIKKREIRIFKENKPKT